jgi:thioester reductase-like protein
MKYIHNIPTSTEYKNNKDMKQIIINGANGYIASHFINELLSNNFEVTALIRKSKNQQPSHRMQKVLAEINDPDFMLPKRLRVYEYTLTEENFSFTDEQLPLIFSQPVDYFHFAASLKYDFKSKDEIFETNLAGVENSLNIFSKYAHKNSRFFFISTAYSCGRMTEPFKEEFYENEDIASFRNYYEQSKRYAENIVRRYIEQQHINGHILRLSQIVGNSKTGVTNTDYGIFDFAKRVYSLSKTYPNSTIRVCIDPDSAQNLLPIDMVTKYLMKTVQIDHLPVILNFVAKNSIKNAYIIDSLNNLLPIKLIPVKTLSSSDMTAWERMISIGMSFTGSYSNTNLIFETKNLDKITNAGTNEVNPAAISWMLEYFLDALSLKKQNVS